MVDSISLSPYEQWNTYILQVVKEIIAERSRTIELLIIPDFLNWIGKVSIALPSIRFTKVRIVLSWEFFRVPLVSGFAVLAVLALSLSLDGTMLYN